MARHELVERALRILETAGRSPERGSHEWWTEQWQTLAKVTNGLRSDDPRLSPVLVSLAVCDQHYQASDMDGFNKAVERVRRLMCFAQGAKVRWEGSENHRLCVLGPAIVETVHCDNGKLWVWTSWRGVGRWVNESIITKIDGVAQ